MNRTVRGIFCTLAGGTFWGFSGACGQYLFTNYHINSSWLTVVRMLGAGIVLTIFSFLCQREKPTGIWRRKGDVAQLILFALFGLMFSQYSYLNSIFYSNAGTATVLQYLGPVLIMALVCAWNRKFPSVRETSAIVLAVLGTFLLATHGNPRTMALSRNGLIWGLLSAVSLACYTLLPSKIIPKWGSMVVTGFGMLIGGVVLACLIQVWRIPVTLDAKGWLAVGGVVLMGTIFAYTLYLQGVADVGAVRASMLASVEPVSATLFSVLWLHTAFQLIDLAGFVCIITTVFLLARKEQKQTLEIERE
ncbi:MAG: DMT family transporter [Oscillospiraceae bacterium]|jgi:drug/metabolite transporter (DMT)-like permease